MNRNNNTNNTKSAYVKPAFNKPMGNNRPINNKPAYAKPAFNKGNVITNKFKVGMNVKNTNNKKIIIKTTYDIIKHLKTIPVDNRIYALVNSNLFSDFLKIIYNPNDTRVLISPIKLNDVNRHSPLAPLLNGIILDVEQLKFVCVPPMGFKVKVLDTIKQDLEDNKYDIYSGIDGTMVNFYYYNNKWCIGTNKGIQMNDTIWHGISYKNALTAIFKKYKINIKKDFEKKNTYTFIIQHPKFHLFVEDYTISLVSIVDNDTYTKTLNSNLRKPVEESPFKSIPAFKPLEITLALINSTNEKALKTFIDTGVKHYGYMLRSKNYENNVMDVFLPSSLSTYITRKFYDIKVDLGKIEDRFNYILIKNFLKNDPRFNNMFKAYACEVDNIKTQISKIINDIISSEEYTKEIEYNLSKYLMFKDKRSPLYKKQITQLLLHDSNTEILYRMIKF